MSNAQKAWPPPDPDWPPHVVTIYKEGCDRIDRLRKQLDPETGAIPIPFICYLCEAEQTKLGMIQGEGLPICRDCLGFDVASLVLEDEGAARA